MQSATQSMLAMGLSSCSSANEYLETYLESVETLPVELQRRFSGIREVDASSYGTVEQLDMICSQQLDNLLSLDPIHQQAVLNELLTLLDHTCRCSVEKERLASESYELVELHVRTLDHRHEIYRNEIGGEKKDEEYRESHRPTRVSTYRAPSTVPVHSANGGAQANLQTTSVSGTAPVSASIVKSGNGNGNTSTRLHNNNSTQQEGRSRKDTSHKRKNDSDAEKESTRTTEKRKRKEEKKKKLQAVADTAITDEPLYCVCNRGSYGDMIGCDYKHCKIEWFHFGCVGLTIKPKGKWYCSDACTKAAKERRK